MDIISGVYKITCTPTGKLYVGSSSRNIYQRWQNHKRELKKRSHPNKILVNAWNKYGESSFQFEVLEICAPDQCLNREQFYLDTIQPFPPVGFNINPCAHSRIGAKLSEDSRRKISESNKGKTLPPELLKKWSDVKKGTRKTDEHKQKIGLAHKGKKVPPLSVKKMADKHRKSYECIDPSGVVYTTEDMALFCLEHGLDKGAMYSVATGYRGHHKGWKCKYTDEKYQKGKSRK